MRCFLKLRHPRLLKGGWSLFVRFWGTRGSIAVPGERTAKYGGNTACVEVRTDDGTIIVLDCGTGARGLGHHLLQSAPQPLRVHLFIGHTHWDHIQGFPFFSPAFHPNTELNIYAHSGFHRRVEDALAGQMQYSYFPVRLHDLRSRIHFTELNEGFFRIGEVLVQTQYLNHTAPTLAYRISSHETTLAYVTDHEPYWKPTARGFHHPGDQRQVAFLEGADLIIHDAQYSDEEYAGKIGWGHSTVEYATDVALAAGCGRLALFHHDPAHDDATVARLEAIAQDRAAARGRALEVFAAAEGRELHVRGSRPSVALGDVTAIRRPPVAGKRVLVVNSSEAEIAIIGHLLAEDNLVLLSTSDKRTALECAPDVSPDLAIIAGRLSDGLGVELIQPLRTRLDRPDFPIILLTNEVTLQSDLQVSGMPATDCLTKPFSTPMLRTRVLAWLTRALPPGKARADETISRGIPKPVPPGLVRVVQSTFESPLVGQVLAEIGYGEVFGELSMLTDQPRTATVVAVEHTRCLALAPDDFMQVLQRSPDLAIGLLRGLAWRLTNADRLLARYAPDPLTGLPGRRAFHDHYQRLAAGPRRRQSGVILLLLDVVHLNEINDRFGYLVGDEVLRAVADALRRAIRTTDLVARYGGDEFAALLVDAGPANTQVIVNRVHDKLTELALRRGLPVTIQCAIGVSSNQDPPVTADELLWEADEDIRCK